MKFRTMALFAVLMTGTVSLQACIDANVDLRPGQPGEECTDPDGCEDIVPDCEETPNDPSCQVDCEETPNDPSCLVDCEETPNDPSCQVDCEETPDDPSCEQNTDDVVTRDEPVVLYLADVTNVADDILPNQIGVGFDKFIRNVFDESDNISGDIAALLADQIQDDHIDLIFQATDYPVDVQDNATFELGVWKATSSSSWAERQSGDGLFALRGGALANVANADNTEGVVHAELGDLALPWQASWGGATGDGTLQLRHVELNAAIQDEDDRVSAGPATEVDGQPVNYIAGAIDGQSIVAAMNGIFQNLCNLTGDLMVLNTNVEGPAPDLQLNTLLVDELINSSEAVCAAVGAKAEEKLPAVVALFDVANEDGVLDGISFAFHITLVPGTLSTVRAETAYAYLSALSVVESDTNGIYNAIHKTMGIIGDDIEDATNVVSIDPLLQDLIDSGKFNGLFELNQFPLSLDGESTFDARVLQADSEDDASTRLSGQGAYILRPQELGVAQSATIQDGVMTLDIDALSIPWRGFVGIGQPDPEYASGTIVLHDVVVKALLEEDDAAGLYTPTGSANTLTAWIEGDTFVDTVNNVIGALCEFSGELITLQDVDNGAGLPLIEVDADIVSDLQNPADPTSAAANVCKAIGDNIEAKRDGIARLFTIDSDGNGTPDAITAAFHIELTGVASVTE